MILQFRPGSFQTPYCTALSTSQNQELAQAEQPLALAKSYGITAVQTNPTSYPSISPEHSIISIDQALALQS